MLLDHFNYVRQTLSLKRLVLKVVYLTKAKNSWACLKLENLTGSTCFTICFGKMSVKSLILAEDHLNMLELNCTCQTWLLSNYTVAILFYTFLAGIFTSQLVNQQ